MFKFAKEIISDADDLASRGATLQEVLDILRRLSLDDFGLLLISQPNPEWPSLSKVLPRMAESKVQERFTGRSGMDLYKQTAAFVRQVENSFVRYTGEPLSGKNILDFGCGYGRLIRMMYYYSDPSQIWGLDAENAPLGICRDDGVQAHFEKTDNIPSTLPVPEQSFDIAYAFSVFTHLPRHAAEACMAAVKEAVRPGGIFIATIWPVEIWRTIDEMRKTDYHTTMPAVHERDGIAHVPHEVHRDYGLTSMSPQFFEAQGWEYLGYDSSLVDRNQVSAILRRR